MSLVRTCFLILALAVASPAPVLAQRAAGPPSWTNDYVQALPPEQVALELIGLLREQSRGAYDPTIAAAMTAINQELSRGSLEDLGRKIQGQWEALEEAQRQASWNAQQPHWESRPAPFDPITALWERSDVSLPTKVLATIFLPGPVNRTGGFDMVMSTLAPMAGAPYPGGRPVRRYPPRPARPPVVSQGRPIPTIRPSSEQQRYDRYWEQRSGPYGTPLSTRRRYAPDGRIKQVTSYDVHGNRHRQYDLVDKQHGEHVHSFTYDAKHPRPHGRRDSNHVSLTDVDR